MEYVIRKCNSRKATVKVTLDAGSAVEYGKWTNGMAHFVEHMIFQSTSKFFDSFWIFPLFNKNLSL